jgi:hypothetical protein
LFDLPHAPHSMDTRRALPGYSAEIKKSRRLRLVWMRKLLRRSRKFTREDIEDSIYEKAFYHGLRQNGLIGNPAWNNPSLRIKNMSQYMSSTTANNSDKLLYASFLCEQAQFRGCRRWKIEIQNALPTQENLKFPRSEEFSIVWLLIVRNIV